MVIVIFSWLSLTCLTSSSGFFTWLWSVVVYTSSRWHGDCSWSSLFRLLRPTKFSTPESLCVIFSSWFFSFCLVSLPAFDSSNSSSNFRICVFTFSISIVSWSFSFSNFALFFSFSLLSSCKVSSSWRKKLFSLRASSKRFSKISLQTLASCRWKLSCRFWFFSMLISSLIVSQEHRISTRRTSKFAAFSILSFNCEFKRFLSDSLWSRSFLRRSQSLLALANSNSSFNFSLVTFKRSSSSFRFMTSSSSLVTLR